MAFPELVPSSRTFSPGDFPIKKFNAQNGAEVRILYGSRMVNQVFELSYANISDNQAESFLADYRAQNGTFRTFVLPDAVFEGWTSGRDIGRYERGPGTLWRYDAPPAVVSVRPGISSVTVKLRAVA
ncbi:MAG: hypothetical protein EBT12_04800 [Marivivens sp.]|nr:hypothetical protein [Marivivens sp.]